MAASSANLLSFNAKSPSAAPQLAASNWSAADATFELHFRAPTEIVGRAHADDTASHNVITTALTRGDDGQTLATELCSAGLLHEEDVPLMVGLLQQFIDDPFVGKLDFNLTGGSGVACHTCVLSRERQKKIELVTVTAHASHAQHHGQPAMCPTPRARKRSVTWADHVGAEAEGTPADLVANIAQLKEFECGICFELLLDPVTTPCGHTMCKHCAVSLRRSCSGPAVCPVDRKVLPDTLSVTYQLANIIQHLFPALSARRREEIYGAQEGSAAAASKKAQQKARESATSSFSAPSVAGAARAHTTHTHAHGLLHPQRPASQARTPSLLSSGGRVHYSHPFSSQPSPPPPSQVPRARAATHGASRSHIEPEEETDHSHLNPRYPGSHMRSVDLEMIRQMEGLAHLGHQSIFTIDWHRAGNTRRQAGHRAMSAMVATGAGLPPHTYNSSQLESHGLAAGAEQEAAWSEPARPGSHVPSGTSSV